MATLNSKVTRKGFIAGAAGALVSLTACTRQNPSVYPATTEATTADAPKVDLNEFEALALDMAKWHYDAEHDAWWQLGLEYCINPATSTYETLAIYVPGAYLVPVNKKTKLEDAKLSDTFEVEVNSSGAVGSFNATTAPILLPINAPEYAAQTPASNYLFNGLDEYLSAGCIYVYAGFRGRSNGYDNNATSGDGFFAGGCPWAATELKAAIRYLRYNAGALPGDTSRVIAFGLGSGGLLAEVLGASGSSELYAPYLDEIGAATHDNEGNSITDDICAVAAWCPDTAPAHADAAFEWELGQFGEESGTRADGTWTRTLSENLAAAYAAYVDNLSLIDSDGDSLSLDETDGGLYTDGSYYEYLLSLTEDAAATFFANTEFPAAVGGTDQPSGYFPGSGKSTEELTVTFAAAASADTTDVVEGAGGEQSAHDDAPGLGDGAISSDTDPADGLLLFASRSDYIDSLNASYRWISYNESRNTVRIADLSSYVSQCRPPALPVPAFDALDRSGENNQLFGNGETETLHYSQDIADCLANNSDVYAQEEGFSDEYATAWAQDLRETDAKGNSVETRRHMYDPLYYVGSGSSGFGSAQVAKHWRINVGLAQTTTPLSGSVNVALALKAYDGVENVVFTPVWEAPRSLAEQDSISAPKAFVTWVSGLFDATEE